MNFKYFQALQGPVRTLPLLSVMDISIHEKDWENSVIFFLVGCVLRPINSEVILRRHPHSLSLVKDVKLGKYTVPTENLTPGRRVAVHYTTAAPRKLLLFKYI